MDQPQYTTLMEALQTVPDPRCRRGKRYNWTFLLTLIGSAVTAGQRSSHAISHWLELRSEALVEKLQPAHARVPSEATIWRTLQMLDIDALEACVSGLTCGLVARGEGESKSEGWRGQAIDGKELRGMRAHGRPLYLLSQVDHATGIVLRQCAVGAKTNEITAVPLLLAGQELHGCVLTMDALLTQREIAQQIRDQHGHYLMVVKENQPHLYEAIKLLFRRPPWTRQEQIQEYDVYEYRNNKEHGRLETRKLESSTALNEYLDWPGMGQVLRRRCRRVDMKTGVISREVTYGITSLRPHEAGAKEIEALWRGHWTIENKVHYPRDVTFGEDACQMHTGSGPQALAALRNALLSILRSQGWRNLADAVRHFDASLTATLELIGASPG